MGFTLTSVAFVERHEDSTLPRPSGVTAQTKRAKEPFHKPLSDRIRTGVRFAPHSGMPKDGIGPTTTDRLRGIGPGHAIAAMPGWSWHGPDAASIRFAESTCVAVLERPSGDTTAIICTREHARRIGAWIPAPSFISPIPGITPEV